ncbi:hypothetical protein BJ508DRAFT_82928 [Ascobolus immersus RN42]|uniref:Uncharacterized protein n=1 Tax=Ascobolus immersus RN42 TaxID=1160509 RepID=A0A3N4I9D5_ASCIM|nr:hypothetical protein BJ508DRAFT_82928 [Ascobolus immersus RN42]
MRKRMMNCMVEQYIEGKNTLFLQTETFKSFNLPTSTAEGLGYLLPRNLKAFRQGLTADQIQAQAIPLRVGADIDRIMAGPWNTRRWTALAIACNGRDYLEDEKCLGCHSGGGPFQRCSYWEGNSRYRCSNCAWDNVACRWPQIASKVKTKPKKRSLSTSIKAASSAASTDRTVSADATISVLGDMSEPELDDHRIKEPSVEVRFLGDEPIDDDRPEDTQYHYGNNDEVQLVEGSHQDSVDQVIESFKIFKRSNPIVHTVLGHFDPETTTAYTKGLSPQQISGLGISIVANRWPESYEWRSETWKAIAIALKGEIMEGEDACKVCKKGKGRFTQCYIWKEFSNKCANCMLRKTFCKEPAYPPKNARPSTTTSNNSTQEPEPETRPEPMQLDEESSQDYAESEPADGFDEVSEEANSSFRAVDKYAEESPEPAGVAFNTLDKYVEERPDPAGASFKALDKYAEESPVPADVSFKALDKYATESPEPADVSFKALDKHAEESPSPTDVPFTALDNTPQKVQSQLTFLSKHWTSTPRRA